MHVLFCIEIDCINGQEPIGENLKLWGLEKRFKMLLFMAVLLKIYHHSHFS